MSKIVANIFGWIGLLIICAGAISVLAAILPIVPIALIGLLLILPAAVAQENKEGEKNDE